MFIPPFCPNSHCSAHETPPDRYNWYQHRGSYLTMSAGVIKRFSCVLCGQGFSERTFSIDYFTKKLVDYRSILTLLASSMGLRQISRFTSLSTGTLSNRFDRLSRQSVSLHSHIGSSHTLTEDLVADEFETFSVSQFFPEYYHLLVGKGSQYLYFFTHMQIRRKGRMTEEQKSKRDELYRKVHFGRGRQRKSFDEVMGAIRGMCREGQELTLYTDEKHAYIPALQRLCAHTGLSIEHHRTNSKEPRTFVNPLFAVNYFDREIRKDSAAHVRETVRFNRNVSAGLVRLSCYALYHNFIKRYRIRDEVGEQRRHYLEAGIVEPEVEQRLEKIFTDRVFMSREKIEGFWRRLWFKQIPTPLKEGAEYVPKFAYG